MSVDEIGRHKRVKVHRIKNIQMLLYTLKQTGYPIEHLPLDRFANHPDSTPTFAINEQIDRDFDFDVKLGCFHQPPITRCRNIETVVISTSLLTATFGHYLDTSVLLNNKTRCMGCQISRIRECILATATSRENGEPTELNHSCAMCILLQKKCSLHCDGTRTKHQCHADTTLHANVSQVCFSRT